MNLLRTIFIFLLVYLGIRLIMRYVLPVIIRIFFKKAQKNFHDRFEEQRRQQEAAQYKDGEVYISKDPKRKGGKDKGDGEYIDFEEVKD